MTTRLKFICVVNITLIAIIGFNSLSRLYSINQYNYNEAGDISVLTFNVNLVGEIEKVKDNDQLSTLLAVIRLTEADIVCIQEMSSNHFELMADSLDSVFGYNDSYGNINDPLRYYIYSRKPLRNYTRYKCYGDIDTIDFNKTEYEVVSYLAYQMPLFSAEIEIMPNNWVTVFSCHLQSSAYSTARREMNTNDNWFKGVPQYYRNYRIGKRIRDYEADNVHRYVDSIHALGRPVIVAGDFNDWSNSYCMHTIEDDSLKDAWWEGGNGFGWTYFGWNLRLRLDHILFSNDFELIDVEVIDTDMSDHKPLFAKFKLK